MPDDLSRGPDGTMNAPSVDKVRGVLRKSLREKRFHKVPHVVNLLRTEMIAHDAEVLNLLADCYESMDPPRLDAARQFRSWALAAYAGPSSDDDDSTLADHARARLVQTGEPGKDVERDAEHAAMAERLVVPRSSLTDARDFANFVIDRAADRSFDHVMTEEGDETSPNEPTVDNVLLLDEIIGNLPKLVLQPEFAHLGALYEITTPNQSRPRYKSLDEIPQGHMDKVGAIAVQCEVRLSLSPQLQTLVRGEPIRCVAAEATFFEAQRVVAGTVIAELEKRAEQVRRAALEKLRRDLSLKINAWKSGNVRDRCHDAFKRVQEVVLAEDYAKMYGAKVRPYGSYAIGLAQEGSDLDVEVVLPRPDSKMRSVCAHTYSMIRVLRYLSRKLEAAKMNNVVVFESARVPVIRYFDHDHGISVDITIADRASVVMSRFMRHHLNDDVRIWELCMFVKYWSQRRGISSTPRGFIGAIGWTMMAVWFLQQVAPPVCSFFDVKNLISKHDCRDVIIKRIPWKDHRRTGVNKSSTEELIGQFFEFYTGFDFSNMAISLSYQCALTRNDIDRNRTRPIFIENPVRPCVNVTAGVHPDNLRITQTEMRRAHHAVINTGSIQHICAVPSEKSVH